jgi:hypothetical protein
MGFGVSARFGALRSLRRVWCVGAIRQDLRSRPPGVLAGSAAPTPFARHRGDGFGTVLAASSPILEDRAEHLDVRL